MPWSVWQPPFQVQHLVDITQYYVTNLDGNFEISNIYEDPYLMTKRIRDQVEAGTGTISPAEITSNQFIGLGAGSANPGTIEVNGDFDSGYRAATLLGSTWQNYLDAELPNALSALTLNTDYLAIPASQRGPYTRGQYLDFESTSTTFAGWEDLSAIIYLYCYYTQSAAAGNENFVFPSALPFTFWATTPINLDRPPNGGTGTVQGDWQRYEAGQVLLHTSVATPSVMPNAYYAANNSVTVPLSNYTNPDVTVVFQSRYLEPGSTLPGRSIAMESVGAPYEYYQMQVFLKIAFDNYLPSLRIPFLASGARVRYTTPRWRYWAIGPATGVLNDQRVVFS